MSEVALTEGVFYILLSLLQPLHGYGIMQNVGYLSRGRVRLAPGTLYGALNTLLARGWIVPVQSPVNDRQKRYVITPLGRRIVTLELERLHELTANGDALLTQPHSKGGDAL